jgi:hypothetical protein
MELPHITITVENAHAQYGSRYTVILLDTQSEDPNIVNILVGLLALEKQLRQ